MAGINFNDLPKNLQQTLQPFYFATGSVDEAIEAAKQNGKWHKVDEEAYQSFNGNKAWGVFDGFEKTETARFQADVQSEMKKNPTKAMAKASSKGIQRDRAQNPEKYEPKSYPTSSGGCIVYQKNPVTGKDTYRFFNNNGGELTPDEFLAYEPNLKEFRYITGKEDYLPTAHASTTDKTYIASKAGTLYTKEYNPNAVSGFNGQVFVLTSCQDHEDTINNFTYNDDTIINIPITFDTSSLLTAMAQQNQYLQQIANNTAQIQNNTNLTNEEIEALKKEIEKLLNEVKSISAKVTDIITNQVEYATSAQNYFQQIVNVIGDNNDLLAFVVDHLAKGNTILADIRAMMEENNADNKTILEALSKCNYSLEVLHKDNQDFQKDVKAMINEVKVAINNLPDSMKEKFSGYFNSILVGIADNGAKLEALTNLLKVVNANMKAGHTAILEKMDKMQAVLDALFDKFTNFDTKVTNALNAIATAIANMTAKIDKLDLSKIEKTLSQILDKIGQNKTELENVTKLLTTINGNVTLNGARQEKILEAINKLGDFGVKITGDLDVIINKIGQGSGADYTTKLDELIKLLQQMDANNETRNQKIIDLMKKYGCEMSGGFAKLIEIGNKNNSLTETTNKLINKVIELLENGWEIPDIQVNLDEVIKAINDRGMDISGKLVSLYSLLTTINANVVQGNKDLNITLGKILEAIKNKTCQGVDLSRIENTLDEILKAIKDHKVLVEVDVNTGTPTVKPNPDCPDPVNEGVIEDLQWLLG